MRNDRHFENLIPLVVRTVPFILQSHAFKGYLALENLRAEHPDWPPIIWQYCISVMREDEPKVEGLLATELLTVPAFIDATSGRDFGPDWILARGLMPLSYWAMRKKVHELGFEAVFRTYMAQALDHPIYLGHELSVLGSYWLFYQSILAASEESEWLEYFIQRFTEFVLVTFDQRNAWVYPHPVIDEIPSEEALLQEALENPGFFGHNLLAFVWTQRLRDWLDVEQYQTALRNLTVHVRWMPEGEVITKLQPEAVDGDMASLGDRFQRFFLDGPRNVHQITLADALCWVWQHYPEHRGLCLTNLSVFTEGTRPAASPTT